MAKFLKLKTDDPDVVEYIFKCPGCNGGAHMIRTQGERPRWDWNGDVDKPTCSPSLLVGPGTSFQCHSFIRDGQIQFLDDCWHELRGQTVDIPDWQ